MVPTGITRLADSGARPRIAVLDDFHGVAGSSADWSRVSERADVTFHGDHAPGDALAARLVHSDAIVLMRERSPLQADMVARLPRLKAVFTTGVRNAAIDLDAATAGGIVVCGTESASATAELALAMMLTLSRQIVADDGALRQGRWQSLVGSTLQGKTLGSLGLGKLGAQVARFGRGSACRPSPGART